MLYRYLLGLVFAVLSVPAQAFSSNAILPLRLTDSAVGIAALVIFVCAYALVMAEEFIQLRKSKPVILAAGLIWILVAYLASTKPGGIKGLELIIEHSLVEYASLFLFLLVAMTYINAMSERKVFDGLRAYLIARRFSYRRLFWITGVIAFLMSPVADNLTTALLLGTVVMTVGIENRRFVAASCVGIVVAANAGGAFSPFGDLTTLMVWQSGNASFFEFFDLFLPAVVNYLVPAIFLSLAVPSGKPTRQVEHVQLKRGAFVICTLFIGTIATAVSFEQILHLPPYLGMMLGFSYLLFYSYYLQMTSPGDHREFSGFNIFNEVAQAEWDTLLFFFGIIFCVGGLGYVGYLEILSTELYEGWGATAANVTMGVLSAVIDNIPVMFAILTMDPDMNLYQWLLITLTTGVGGSLLSIGSAAGVALMGQARGIYTFFEHLKWSWAIAIGYACSIATHYLLNGS